MPELSVELVDEANFHGIPAPARRQARCQTCDYWERLDGSRVLPDDTADADARAALKLRRLLAGVGVTGSYGMLAVRTDTVDRTVVGYAQFGPISAYPRALSIRERYPQLPDSPAPWVVTCVQVVDEEGRVETAIALLRAVCEELDRRGVTSVEAYPERVADAWLPPAGPVAVYEGASFVHVAGDEHYPVYRRELTGETDPDAWSDLLRAARPDEGDDWPMPPPGPSDDDFFRLPADGPKRPNPFGDD